MKHLDHWFVCLDLTQMDDILIGYANFLTSIIKPQTISFVHIVESFEIADEMIELFPELENRSDFDKVIRKELKGKINDVFSDSDFETRLIIKEGWPTDQLIELNNSINPDLMIMGSKAMYEGEGTAARKIMRFIPSSILFVPENCRYQIKKILVPTDFSAQSAKAIQYALDLVEVSEGSVTAQHIYSYPRRFFPYMPDEGEEEKMKEHLEKKKEEFTKKYSLPDDVEFNFILHIDEMKMDLLYDQAIKNQADLLLAASKANKKIPALLRENFIDKIAGYRFGIPLLIQKDKKKHTKFLESIFNKD